MNAASLLCTCYAALTHLRIGLRTYGVYGITLNAKASKAYVAVTLHDPLVYDRES